MSENNSTPQTETSVESTQIPIIRMNVRAATETIMTPVDANLQTEGVAADAAATGAALATKADQTTVDGIQVDGVGFADGTTNIPLNAGDIPVTGETGADSIADVIEAHRAALAGLSGANIPVNGETGATSIEAAIGAVQSDLNGKNATNLPISGETGATSIGSAIAAVQSDLDAKNGSNIPITGATGASSIYDAMTAQGNQYLTKASQELTNDEKSAVRTNIGLGSAATRDIYNGLDKDVDGYALDARQGAALNTSIGSLSTAVTNVANKFNVTDLTSGVTYTPTGSSYKASIVTDSLRVLRIGYTAHIECQIKFAAAQDSNAIALRGTFTGIPKPFLGARGVCGNVTQSLFVHNLSTSLELYVRFLHNGNDAAANTNYIIVIEYMIDDGASDGENSES